MADYKLPTNLREIPSITTDRTVTPISYDQRCDLFIVDDAPVKPIRKTWNQTHSYPQDYLRW